jgi:hypothetical protein
MVWLSLGWRVRTDGDAVLARPAAAGAIWAVAAIEKAFGPRRPLFGPTRIACTPRRASPVHCVGCDGTFASGAEEEAAGVWSYRRARAGAGRACPGRRAQVRRPTRRNEPDAGSRRLRLK